MATVHNEPWQVFAENGEPVVGHSETRENFTDDLVMAASHVWLWRRHAGVIEILLQKRSSTKVSWPGYYDISIAGHIDAGETAVQSAVREGAEEIGVVLNPENLRYIFSLRTSLSKNEIDHVFLYELVKDVPIEFNDGEVDEVVWVSLDDFLQRCIQPDQYNLLNQGEAYFAALKQHLVRI